jgi:NAD(P)H-hydrate epimerase
MKIVTVAQMQKAERDCAGFGISLDRLMENAGKAVAEELRRILVSVERQSILVLVGPGNNGGDGLVAARHLHDWGAEVKILLCGQRASADSNLEQVKKRDIVCVEAENNSDLVLLNNWLWGATVVLDSLFGTGKIRPVSGVFAQALNIVKDAKKKSHLRIIALDLHRE